MEVETDPDYNDLANAPPHPFTKASWGDSLLREAVKNNGKYEVKGARVCYIPFVLIVGFSSSRPVWKCESAPRLFRPIQVAVEIRASLTGFPQRRHFPQATHLPVSTHRFCRGPTVIDGRLVDSVAGKYKNEFRGRGKTRHNHATTHVPIVLDVKNSSSDTVTWTCAEPFYLEVETDPDYNDLANAPPHPFTKASWGDSLLREANNGNQKFSEILQVHYLGKEQSVEA